MKTHLSNFEAHLQTTARTRHRRSWIRPKRWTKTQRALRFLWAITWWLLEEPKLYRQNGPEARPEEVERIREASLHQIRNRH